MIGFLHPWALAGLVAAAVPILLHLLARREPPTVVFPAVRYLITTTREHQRRLKLQHLLLLALRTLLIVALVLAAAGPTVPSRGVAGHAPSALVLVVDNSPSSGVVVAGSSRLSELQRAARRVLGRATPDDALWLVTADGVPRRGDRQALLSDVDALPVSLKLATCNITDTVSITNTPPITSSTISWRTITATQPSAAPIASAPTSPMNTCAG
jgi:hypothetical protein